MLYCYDELELAGQVSVYLGRSLMMCWLEGSVYFIHACKVLHREDVRGDEGIRSMGPGSRVPTAKMEYRTKTAWRIPSLPSGFQHQPPRSSNADGPRTQIPNVSTNHFRHPQSHPTLAMAASPSTLVSFPAQLPAELVVRIFQHCSSLADRPAPDMPPHPCCLGCQ